MADIPSNMVVVIGDPAMVRVAELRAISKLSEGHEMEPTRRHRWSSASDDEATTAAFRSLMPSIIDEAMRLVIWISPPIGLLQRAAKVCSTSEQHYLIVGYEADTWDKRSKVLKQMDADGSLHSFGFIRSFDHARFRSAVEMIVKAEGVSLSPNCIQQIEALGHLHRRPVVTKSGRKSERLVHDLGRVRQEVLKAQLHAGWGNPIDASDISAVCSPSHRSEPWDAMDAIFDGNLADAVKHLDGCVDGQSEARQILGLIRSQAEMLLNVRAIVEGSSLRNPNDIATGLRSVATVDRYDLWDPAKEPQTVLPPDSYRVKKLMDLRGKPPWSNAASIVNVCIDAHADLVGALSGEWDVVLIRTVIDVCNLCSPR